MASDSDSTNTSLTSEEQTWLARIRSAERLSDLLGPTGTDSEHDAYFAAKQRWSDLQEKKLGSPTTSDGIPGDRVALDGRTFWVYGITHADTEPEGEFLREHVSRLIEAGESVYCEQGIRSMYFDDFAAVCEMDDYRWAMNRCRELDVESHVEFDLGELSGPGGTSGGSEGPSRESDEPSRESDEPSLESDAFEGLTENLDSVLAQFRDAAFALIESGGDVYGEEFAAALGDVASDFLTSHEDAAIGEEFESFRKSKLAAEDPEQLVALQNYYRKAFLPQPLEREWLARHDRELELVTHARNERMADYARYHAEDADQVHLIVGAAHQPGVVYYLERHRDGDRTLDGFELTG